MILRAGHPEPVEHENREGKFYRALIAQPAVAVYQHWANGFTQFLTPSNHANDVVRHSNNAQS